MSLGARAVEELPRDAARAGDGHAQQGVRARHRLYVPPAEQFLEGSITEMGSLGKAM